MKHLLTLPKKPRIEMVPLIDCFFLILIFFVYGVLSMVVQKGILMELPKASTSILSRDDYLSISISKEGEIFVNKEPVALDQLSATLRQKNPDTTGKKVFINADKLAYHGKVIKVLDIARSVGIKQVYFGTEPGKDND